MRNLGLPAMLFINQLLVIDPQHVDPGRALGSPLSRQGPPVSFGLMVYWGQTLIKL